MEYRVLGTQASSILKSLRKQKGLTQQQLGERVGVSQRIIARIEANPGSVRFDRILQVISELGVELIIREQETEKVKSDTVDGDAW